MAETLILSQDIGDGEVLTAAVADSAITTAKVADASVSNGKLADGAVTSAKIANATIVGDKLVANTITATQIGANAVTASELADGSVDTNAIQDAAVTLAKISSIPPANIIVGDGLNNPSVVTVSGDVAMADTGVTTIQTNAVETGMILDANVTTDKLAPLSVTGAKIAGSTVTLAKMANDSVGSSQIKADAVGTSELNLNAGYALTGSCSFSQQLTIPATPQADTDAASKGYVDGLVEGLTWKQSVRVLSTANVAIANAPATIDGVTMAAGDRVLLSGQAIDAEKGIYVWASVGNAMSRAADSDTFAELDHAAVFIQEGTNADEGFTQTVTLSAFTGQDWVQFSGAGNITAGDGLTKAGNTINVGTFTGVTVNPDTMAVDYGSALQITTISPDASAEAGTLDDAARADHVHAITCATPVAISTTLSEGISGNFARADHVHKLGTGSINSSGMFGPGVVSDAAIAGNAVTAAKLAANAVATGNIQDANVTLDKMAADSVNSSKIENGSILLVDLNSEVTNAMSGFTNRSAIPVLLDGDNVFNVSNNCPLTSPGHLLFINGRLMELGAGKDYTIADDPQGQRQITTAVGRFVDDVISLVFDSSTP